MRTSKLSVAMLAAVALAAGGLAAPAGAVSPGRQRTSAAEMSSLAAGLAREAAAAVPLVEAVKAQNARKASLSEIHRIDAAWSTTRGIDPRMRALMEGPCASALRAFQARGARVASAALLDAQGTTVCMTSKVPHYWWGEQVEFVYAFNNGAGQIWVGKPTYDEGVGDYVVPVVVPLMSGGRAIGAVSLNLLAGQ
jgi:hypothetical protein